MSKFYISTAIAYPNAKPHLGHALEFVQADCLARYHRMIGDEVLYSTGTDEHGIKIAKTAKDENLSPQDLVNKNLNYFTDLCSKLDLSNELFYRTSDEMLKKGAQKLWTMLENAGDIYKKKHSGLYCYGCESFKLGKDLIDGKCENHDRVPDLLEEENYFFRLSKYKEAIHQKIESDELQIYPRFRKREVLNMLDELDDVSFSRPKSSLSWGVEVPSDHSHVMYVWCDALSNYITGLDFFSEGPNYKKFWPNDVNLIGKDIIKFHAIYWPAMLMSVNLPLPKVLMVHGFVTSEGKKMSKTLGNIVDPIEISAKYGTDALRYYLLREIPTLDDGDFAMDRFLDIYNSELANSLGNLLSRVTAMVMKYFGNEISAESISATVVIEVQKIVAGYSKQFANFDLKKAIEEVISLINFANLYVDQQKPWILAKESKNEELKQVLFDLLSVINVIALLLLPYIPKKAIVILDSILKNAKNSKILQDSYFAKNSFLEKTYKISKPEILFPRIDQIL